MSKHFNWYYKLKPSPNSILLYETDLKVEKQKFIKWSQTLTDPTYLNAVLQQNIKLSVKNED